MTSTKLTRAILIPACGRDYKSAKAAKADFMEGKDFKIQDLFSGHDGRMCSCRDFEDGASVEMRFNGLRGVTVFKYREVKE